MRIFYKKGILYELVLLPLIFVSVLFKYLVIIRRQLYRHSILKAYKPSAFTISVGNITLGGTGKTPMVIHICHMLKGKRIAVISRGYRSHGKGVRIVSDEHRLLCDPEVCGDEPFLIARAIPDAIVAVGKKRVDVIKTIEAQYKPDVIILDDGFSHLKVKRDIDIILIDGEKGMGNGHVLPAGPLREPVRAIRYADLIGIKGNGSSIEHLIKRYHAKENIFHFSYRFNRIKTMDQDEDIDIDLIKNKRIIGMAGIGFPDSFFALLNSIGLKPVTCISKSDHAKYTTGWLDKIIKQYKPDAIIVTAKDAVKIRQLERTHNVMWLYVDIAIEDNGQLSSLLANKVK